MHKIKSGSLLPYVFYFLIGFAVTVAGLVFLNFLGVKTFALNDNPSKIIPAFIILSLSLLIADIIINFLINFLRH